MTVVMTGSYLGEKRVQVAHEPSGATLVTDSPRDLGGNASSFSPTDMVAAALGSCVMTTIAIVAERSGLSVAGMHFRVEKHMKSEPREIEELPLVVHMPEKLEVYDRQKLERAAFSCPVHKSLGSHVRVPIQFVYDVR